MSEVKLYSVPDGYALVSVDALRAWGKLDEVKSACVYPAALAQQAPPLAASAEDMAVYDGIAKRYFSDTQPAPSPQPAPVVSDEQIDAATRHLYHNGRPTTKEYRVGIVRAILALRPAVGPMTPEKMREAAMDAMSKIPALANHHSWKGWPGTWQLATAAVNGIAAKAEGGCVMSQSQVPKQDTSDLTFTTTQFEREVLIQSLNCYIDTWRAKQRNIANYVPETPFAITVAGELLEKLRS